MKYIYFCGTGVKVSKLCLCCMTFGVPERGEHPWTLSEQQSRPLIRQAVEAGINFFDTANTYSDGTSEEIVGRALKDFTRRDEVVIATKVFFPVRKGPNGRGLSREERQGAISRRLLRGRPQGRGASRGDCSRPRGDERPGCPGLGRAETLRHGTHSRGHRNRTISATR